MDNEITNTFAFGINVESSAELAGIGEDIRYFMDVMGGGAAEIQVAINPNLVEQGVYEELPTAIGFEIPEESEVYEEGD